MCRRGDSRIGVVRSGGRWRGQVVLPLGSGSARRVREAMLELPLL